MSTKCLACDVEFIGGPIDGHVETLNYPPALFISATAPGPGHIGGWLRRLLPWNRGTATAAIYERHESDGRFRYRYAGSSASLPGTFPCLRVDISQPPGGKGDKI